METYPSPCHEDFGFGLGDAALEKPAVRELFRKNLQRLLKEKDWRPAKLARAVEVDPSAVHAWLYGNTSVTLENLQRIADAFGVPVRELLEDPLDPKTMGIDIDTALRVVVGHVKSVKPTDK